MSYIKRGVSLGIITVVLGFGFLSAGREAVADDGSEDSFHFTVTADMRYNHGPFRKVCRAINQKSGGPGAFHISAGDIEPVSVARRIIDEEFGADMVWYPVLGNHELDDASGSDVEWIKKEFHSLPYIVNSGPVNSEETTYSFDYKNAHFVVLNEYYDGASDRGGDGDIVPELLSWLRDDLDKNTKPAIFVLGHEPAFPLPDEYWKSIRHYGDSLDKYPENRDAFWSLLEEKKVAAYICGHTHRYSHYQHEGGEVWQVVAVTFPPPDNTYRYDAWLNITVSGSTIKFEVYRDVDKDGDYMVYDSWTVSLSDRLACRVL
ncbi:MAG: metallophosphoesterase [Candidatus Omnitrophica bacterium]|nr:metallophosphoesterase [Candidatus Omnitrophota bacterium]MBU1932905.1 metallophosphoesterase [Candidatus Omnitrophota bacterium]